MNVTTPAIGLASPTLPLRSFMADPLLIGCSFSHDLFREADLVTEPGFPPRAITDNDLALLRERLCAAGFHPLAKEHIGRVVGVCARANSFDSLADFVESRPAWDGVPRMGKFFSGFLGAQDSEYVRSVGRYLWTALVGRALRPGVMAQHMPVLIGLNGDQRSAVAQALLPSEFSCTLRPIVRSSDAAVQAALTGHALVEVKDVGPYTDRTESIFQQFVSRAEDRWVKPYKDAVVDRPRRWVGIATANAPDFLEKIKGRRRFLPVKITRGDPAQIAAARDQLLAEALVYFKANDNIDYIAGHYICVKDLVDRGKTPGPWLDLPVPAQEAFASVAANEAGVRHE